jgi:D-glycero-D-manno-heptose 1,7-bisphosphate phosphatase
MITDPETTPARWPEPGSSDWALFVSRDGVLNPRAEDHVRSWAEFAWAPGALPALAALSWWAPYLVVVTHQGGVADGLVALADLDDLHRRMAAELEEAGGRVDSVLVCPHNETHRCACRTPRTGLAEGWLATHPEVAADRCVVVGDRWTDIAMGRVLTRGLGTCVWVRASDLEPEPVPAPDVTFASLAEMAARVQVGTRETA